MAMGSASETEYFLLLARDLNYLDSKTHDELAKKVGQMRRMLNRLILKVQMEAKPVRKREPSPYRKFDAEA